MTKLKLTKTENKLLSTEDKLFSTEDKLQCTEERVNNLEVMLSRLIHNNTRSGMVIVALFLYIHLFV